MKTVGIAVSCVIFLAGLALQAQARPHAIELSAASLSPGATLSLSGTGFGTFQSVHTNKVTVSGVAALIQRWDPDLIEIKVPFKATTGPVEILVGKKKIRAGSVTIVTPQIDALTPAEVERGAVLRITGKHFGTTAGARDPNTMFGVNDVVIGGIVTRPKRWKDDQIEVEVPANAQAGDVIVRLASSDPLPDGSCCAPVEYMKSNAVPLTLIPS
ncbi:MAG TPA: IPT/TIG domain-containing protein, partial [Nitrospira sp.]|nr:IPT/TIG domain-containing protein [Nitrospira sp.]